MWRFGRYFCKSRACRRQLWIRYYILGDSITVRAKHQLETGFKSLDPYINASVSRSIKGAGQTDGFKTSGLEAAADDKARIDGAATVVIALGTKPGKRF